MVSDGMIAYIGIGSNLANPLDQCRIAVDIMGDMPGVKLLRVSSFYRTEPVGVTDQGEFVNAVCEIRTRVNPRPLLALLKSIESLMGRKDERRWGPRLIDLDLLLYGQAVINDRALVIPHPECHKRRFVLVPLNEIASYVIHPAFGVSVKGLLDRLEDNHSVEIISS
jgi:2-amino-4-hydroxy-6-hydroxymethyldihydropteridine diphosphokinase